MIRRGFWLTAGALTGIYGYRRACAVGHRLSASLNPTGSRATLTQRPQRPRRPREARLARRGVIRVARETIRFTRDVREGMELYMARHPAPAGSTLGARDLDTLAARDLDTLAARDLEAERGLGTSHHPRPKDGR